MRALISLALLAACQVRAEVDFVEKLRLAQEAEKASAPAQAAPSPVVTPAKAPKAKTPLETATPEAPPELDGLKARLEALEKKQGGSERLKFEAFTQLRLDRQDSKKTIGLYARRAEAKLAVKVWDSGNAVLGYDFAENKLKDIGLELEAGHVKWQAGQFRQKFGIEPQTGSTKIWFAERAMLYGGSQPLSANAKIVGERAMGLHAIHKSKLGWLGYEFGFSLANNLSEDQAAGKNKIGAADAFAKQLTDEGPSYAGRFGVDLPLGAGKAGVGFSLAQDSQNSLFNATKAADLKYEELGGLDLSLDFPDLWKLQAEWVASNVLRDDLGLLTRREGWLLQQSLQILKFFSPDAPKVELLARFEGVMTDVHAGAAGLAAASAGLKWSAGGSQLLLQYSAYAADMNFNTVSGGGLWVLQEQLLF